MFNITALLDDYVVRIPEIQRDYAQGRESAREIRNALLSDIFEVLKGDSDSLILNYIYGVPDDGKLILIDGQQRITTLFLLKWYLAVKKSQDTSFLKRLEYATRTSSTEFCQFLINNGSCLENSEPPSVTIKNHTLFKKRWIYDPTIVNMINMLDAIDHEYNSVINVEYENLDKIQFSFVSLDGFKRKDELYAAMNSRGKQLTPFELIKGKLLERDASLAYDINGKWGPLFWDLAICYSGDNDSDENNPEEFAANNFDKYLFNFFSFITQMLWCSQNPLAITMQKEEHLPDINKMTDEVYQEARNISFLRASMELVKDELKSYDFHELTRDGSKFQNDCVVIYDGLDSVGTNCFKQCCTGENYSQSTRCYLWAYVKFMLDTKYSDNSQNNQHSLIDYYVLMRGLYMRRASNETPTSVKLSLNGGLLGQVIQPFTKITDGNYDEDTPLRRLFDNKGEYDYAILNNPLVRGCIDNVNDYMSSQLNENLIWIWERINNSPVDVFLKFFALGFSQLKFDNGNSDRVFLPVTVKMLQSLFSIRGWLGSEDYKNLIMVLKDKSISSIQDPDYGFVDWQYYIVKYPSFRNGAFGQYRVDENCDSNEMGFNAEYIENERATKNKIRNPFVYELYKQMNFQQEVDFYDFQNEHTMGFAYDHNSKMFSLQYDNNTYYSDGSEDIIDSFHKQINTNAD